MEKIPTWIERLLLPKLNEITGEIKTLEAKIESVDNKADIRIDSLRKEMLAKFEAADVKVDSLRNEMLSKFEAVDSRFDSLEARFPFMEKMTEFEVRLADCEAF
jgi:dynactin complex subunit